MNGRVDAADAADHAGTRHPRPSCLRATDRPESAAATGAVKP